MPKKCKKISILIYTGKKILNSELEIQLNEALAKQGFTHITTRIATTNEEALELINFTGSKPDVVIVKPSRASIRWPVATAAVKAEIITIAWSRWIHHRNPAWNNGIVCVSPRHGQRSITCIGQFVDATMIALRIHLNDLDSKSK